MCVLHVPGEMAASELGPVTARAEHAGETTYLTKHGHRAAAVVPAEDAELLEALEELVDTEAVHQALEAHAAGDNERVPFVRRTARSSTAGYQVELLKQAEEFLDELSTQQPRDARALEGAIETPAASPTRPLNTRTPITDV
ncbi:hypothetical protein GCM10027174_01760 [Salinifilum aidingensis]